MTGPIRRSAGMASLLLLLLLFLVTPGGTAGPSATATRQFVVIRHMEMATNESLPTADTWDVGCARACGREEGCVSASWYPTQASCTLHLGTNHTVDTSASTRHSLLLVPRGPLADDLLTLPGCGPPPAVEGPVTTTWYDGTLVGDMAVSRCVAGHGSDPPREDRYCQPDLTWSLVSLLNCTRGVWCAAVDPALRVDCGYPNISSTQCEARGCCWDDQPDQVPCYFTDRAVPQEARRLLLYSPSFCEVYTPTGPAPATTDGHQGVAVTVQSDIRVLTVFFYGPAGVRARLSDGLTLDTSARCHQVPRYHRNVTADWFSEDLNDQDWVNAVNLNVTDDNMADVPETLGDVTPMTLDGAGLAFVYCRWRV